MALVDSKGPDAKPLPIAKMMVHHFLYFAPGRVDQGAGSCWRGAGFIGGRGEEHPLGHPQPRCPRAPHDSTASTTARPTARAPDWRLTAMVMNHYKKPEELLRAHEGLVHDRARGPRSADRDRQLRPARQRHVIRRARRRPKGSNYVNSSDWVAPVQRPAAGRIVAPARRRQVPDARQPHLQAAAVQGARLPRPAQPPVQRDPADPARAGPDRDRRLRHREGHPGRQGRGAPTHRGPRRPQPARRGDGLLGHLVPPGRLASSPAPRCPTTSSRSTSPSATTTRRTTTWSCPSCRSREESSAPSTAAPRGRRRVLPARQDHGQGRPAGHVDVLRRYGRTA